MSSIKFTVKLENIFKLPFLDVLIHRVGKNLSTARIENLPIWNHIIQPITKELDSTFSFMFLRALRVCSPEFMENELKHIYETGAKSKYPRIFLKKALEKARKNNSRTDPAATFDKNNLLVLPFCDNFVHIPRHLKPLNVNVIFRNNSNVKHMLVKNSPNNARGCVYKIPCKDCDNCYIGQKGK